MTSSADDETEPPRRHRSGEPRMPRWRRRPDEEVAELDPDDVAALLRRAADADRLRAGESGAPVQQRVGDDTSAGRRVISDALVQGLADPTPVDDDRRHLLPRRRAEGEAPAPPVVERPVAEPPVVDHALASRLEEAEARAAAAEERTRELEAELASRDADHDERAQALAAERDGVEGRVRALDEAAEAAAAERERLEQAVAVQSRLLEQSEADRVEAAARNEQYAEQVARLEADLAAVEQRSKTLATETAARATEHSDRVRQLVAEREQAEERARGLADRVSAGTGDQDAANERAARERAALEEALAQAVRLADEARAAKARAEAEVAALTARIERAESGDDGGPDPLADLQVALATAEERIRTLTQDASERNTQHVERVDMLLADVEAAEQAAQESRRIAQQSEARMFEAEAAAQLTVEQRTAALTEAQQALAAAHALAGEEADARAAAEARVASLEKQLAEAHVLPVFSPPGATRSIVAEPVEELAPEPEPLTPPDPIEAPEPELVEEPEPEPVEEPTPVEEPEPVQELEPEDAYDWSDLEPMDQTAERIYVEPEVEPEPVVEPVVAPAPARVPEPVTKRGPAATTYDAKRGSGLAGPGAGLLALASAAAVGWMAYQGTVLDHLTLSLLLTVVALLGLAVALRQRSQTSEVHLERGTLRLRFGDQHHTFYLNSPSTQIEMLGEPGDRDWRVEVLRKGMPPVTIDHKDVDPVAFTATLRHFRPGI